MGGHSLGVAAGVIAGATARWSLFELTGDPSWPWPTLLANVIGSLVLGLTAALVSDRLSLLVIGTGFCGGLTTFSTFAVESAQLARDGDWVAATGYVAMSALLPVGAFAAGVRVRRS